MRLDTNDGVNRRFNKLNNLFGLAVTNFKVSIFFLVIILSCYNLAALGAGLIPDYEVRGIIIEQNMYGSSNKTTREFVCRVNAECWSIDLQVNSGGDAGTIVKDKTISYIKIPDKERTFSNGTNFFSLNETHFDIAPTQGGLLGSAEKKTVVTAKIGPGKTPFAIAEPALVLWYSFASSGYFADRPSAKLFPIHNITFDDVTEKRYLVPGHYTLLGGNSGLPNTIQTSNYFNFTDDPLESVLRSSVFPNTNVNFRVLSSTNIGDGAIPTAVMVDYYFSRKMPSGTRTFYNKQITVNVESIKSPSGQLPQLPEITGTATIEDLRHWFSTPPVQTIVTSSNEWPSSGILARSYNTRKIALSMSGRSNPKAGARLILIGFLLSSPLLIWLAIRVINNPRISNEKD